MAEVPTASHDDVDLLIRVARDFYLNELSKVEIGKELGLSRFKVARLLDEARDRGIVRIDITDPRGRGTTLAEELCRHLSLRDAVVVPPDRDIDTERQSLGAAGARFLSETMHEGDTIGFSWGRTLLPIAANLHSVPRARFVQLTGVIGNDPTQSPIEIISRIQRQTGSTAKALFAPLFPSTPQIAASIRSQPAVQDVFATYRDLDTAVLSVGSWRPRVTQLDQHLSPEDLRLLDQKGTVADFSGFFFDASGNCVETPLNDRRISVSIEDLRRTHSVVAVAGGTEKVDAIHAICCARLLTCLVTTTEVAEALLHKPSISAPDDPSEEED